MKTKTLITGLIIFFLCCAIQFCLAGFAYFALSPTQNFAFSPSVSNPIQINLLPSTATDIPTVDLSTATDLPPVDLPTTTATLPPTQASLAVCPDVSAAVIQASVNGSEQASSSSTSPTLQFLVTYQANGDQIGNPFFESVSTTYQSLQNDSASQLAAWNLFTGLIPPEDRSMVSEYTIFTDGPSNVLAAVSQSQNDPNKWDIEVDTADAQDRKSLVFTLIHEYAHLLTLNSSQVPPDLQIFNNPADQNILQAALAACSNYFPGEGCSNPSSYINVFYSRFWPSILAEWQAIDNLSHAQNKTPYYNQLFTFYHTHQDQFVDDYAPTNPSEDIAETFAYFVLSPQPSGQTIRDQKLQFFYSYPELVQIRSQIINNLCNINP